MRCHSLALPPPSCTKWCGNFVLLPKQSFFFLGFSPKTGFEPPTVFKSVVPELWFVPPLQANNGNGVPSFCRVSYTVCLWSYIWTSLGIPDIQPVPRQTERSSQALVEYHDKRFHVKPKGHRLPHASCYLGTLERA
jgi:hypothetical protein